MNSKKVITFFLAFFFIILLVSTYFSFESFGDIILGRSFSHTNFSTAPQEDLTISDKTLHFASANLSYRFYDCALARKNDFLFATQLFSKETPLTFYEVSGNEHISVYCNNSLQLDGVIPIAGEGGPIELYSKNPSIIRRGIILLYADSACEKPVVAMHELLHVFGLYHSQNPKNIMYPVSRCSQELGADVLEYLTRIYS